MKKLTKMFALVGSLVLALTFVNTASADANPFAQADQVQTFFGDDSKCGDKGDKKCGDKGDKKCGDKGDKKCGDKGDKKCGDKGDKKCGEGKKGKKEGKCGEGKCGGK
ncbi:MAG: putative low-complexity protein [Polaribacter sp.]|jgi:uncharacterized low-complexity protein